jgi:eukaryotic-like serine/threonine-protein kinase
MSELSRLWDESLQVAQQELEAWMEAVAVSTPQIRSALRQMLAGATDLSDGFLQGRADLALGAAGVPYPAAEQVQPGMQVGPYRLLREIGRGGMGTVWLGERSDGLMQRQVALKLPHPWLTGPQFLARFKQERQILASLTHAHIARLYDAGVTPQGQPYLALEYIEGESLEAHSQRMALDTKGRLVLFLQVLDAMQFAHEHHVVHRDLKPSNLLVSALGPSGHVHLLDFGIAKLLADDDEAAKATQFGDAALTPSYASPEQIARRTVGPQSDVYSLGVLLYQLLTGRLPYTLERATRAAMEEAVLSAPVKRPSDVTGGQTTKALRGDVDAIVMTALQREPQRRFISVKAFADDVRRHLAGEQVQSRPDSVAYRATVFVKRYRTAVAATLVVVASLGTGTALAWRSAQQALEQQLLAQRQETIAKESERTTKAVLDFMSHLFTANDGAPESGRKLGEMTLREVMVQGAASFRIASTLQECGPHP